MATFSRIGRLAVGAGCAALLLGCASPSARLDLLRTRYLESRRGEMQRDLDPELQDLTFLVGMSGSRVQGALGPPERCRDPRSTEARFLPWDECLGYTFEIVEIGPAYQLQLRLDRRGNCVEPRWLILAM